MPRRRAAATTSDVTRTVKGLLAAGITIDKIAGVKVTAEGFVVLLADAKLREQSAEAEKSPLDEWRARNG